MFEWVDQQDDWVRDALRRHAVSPGYNLTALDKEEILDRVYHAARADFIEIETKSAKPLCEPLAPEHLSATNKDAEVALLCSLGPIGNVGRLAKDQKLSFAIDGITLVYGENGSGKSGYCRVSKKICRSLSVEDLIGDVFAEGEKPPAEVTVRYLMASAAEGAEPQQELWVDGTPPPEALRHISVFDSRNAQLYISRDNRIEFLPSEVALLEKHGMHRDEMGETFLKERRTIEARLKTPLPAGYSAKGSAAALLKRLEQTSTKVPTRDELLLASEWTESHETELETLTNAIAQDPAYLAAKLSRLVSVAESYLATMQEAFNELGPEAVRSFKVAVSEARLAVATEAAAAQDSFSGEPLSGVGEEPWRSMYYYARAFIASIGERDELPENIGAVCALCQEPLTESGADRMRRFRIFLSEATAQNANQARAALNERLSRLESLRIPSLEDVQTNLAEFGSSNEARLNLVEAVCRFIDQAAEIKNALIGAPATEEFPDFSSLNNGPILHLRDELSAIQREVENLSGIVNSTAAQAKIVSDFNELKDRKKLHDDQALLFSRLKDLQEYEAIKKCIALVGTKNLSRQITAARRKLLADGLDKRIQKEIEVLGLTHIPFAVNDHSRDGQSLYSVGLDSAVAERNERVLSEGEQRALALACFLGEQPESSKHGLIIDDPVSSLDHVRIRKVAQRLAAEAAKGKQVIIFTHNLLFYNEVADAAAQSQVPLVKRVVTKTEAEGFGVIMESDEPWMVRKVGTRIHNLRERLNEFNEVSDFNTDEYRRKVKDFYTDMRETWERLVEELLLGKVVERMNSDVKTLSLRSVEVTDEDHRTVYWAMKRASEFSGHDKATAKDLSAPEPKELRKDVETIAAYRASLDARTKALSERRKGAEAAPSGVTA